MTVSDLYSDLPVTITDDDFLQYRGIDLDRELEGDTKEKITQFLDTVHEHVYNFIIFATGDKRHKVALIKKFDGVQRVVKIALLTQAAFLISNGNIEMWNGVLRSVNGVDIKDNNTITEKIIAPSVINILSSEKPNILFAGR